MRLGDKYPVRYKFWCIIRRIVFYAYMKISMVQGKIGDVHYNYWTHGKTLKELRELKESKEK